MRFSERHGHKPVRKVMQIDSISGELRNSLWNNLTEFIWEKVHVAGYPYGNEFLSLNHEMNTFLRRLWANYWKIPLDSLEDDWPQVFSTIQTHFFKCKWFEVYDLMEFVAANHPFDTKIAFVKACNLSLVQEGAAYRLVNGLITQITDESEIIEIENALKHQPGPVRIHLSTALELMSKKDAPDYRNSVKESISAIESLVAIALGQKGTLGQLIKKLEKDIGLHPALCKSIESLYGYTSDASGIRHALLESSSVNLEEAKFFLVVCSAFVNLVKAKLDLAD